MTKILFALAASGMLALAPAAHAEEDGAFLDPAYGNLRHPRLMIPGLKGVVPAASDTLKNLADQTEVKAQQARGTCSIFSAAAMLEATLVKAGAATTELDLSEEWLEYVIMRGKTSDGSHSFANFRAIADHGMPAETTMPYIGVEWKSLDDDALARQRCGHLETAWNLKSCLLGHWDPSWLGVEASTITSSEFLAARQEAEAFRAEHGSALTADQDFWIGGEAQAKKLLAEGTPVTLDIDFYYGSWNHRLAGELGMERNMDHWYQGIVGYPASRSRDRARSHEKPAGHSVLVVGYDDELVVTVPTLMSNGDVRELKYKGVYYFKNSWGTEGFGKDFTLGGKSFPGYGMITQKYAHEFGSFYKLPYQARR